MTRGKKNAAVKIPSGRTTTTDRTSNTTYIRWHTSTGSAIISGSRDENLPDRPDGLLRRVLPGDPSTNSGKPTAFACTWRRARLVKKDARTFPAHSSWYFRPNGNRNRKLQIQLSVYSDVMCCDENPPCHIPRKVFFLSLFFFT